MEDDGFIKVTYRAAKYKNRKVLKIKQQHTDISEPLFTSAQKDSESIINNINKHKVSMAKTEFFNQFSDLFIKAIKNAETSSEKPRCDMHLPDIVCYGLGSFSMPAITCPQMALLLLIRDISECPNIFLYDPRFTDLDLEILSQLNCVVIQKNEEGKRKIQKRTIFYLPHCGKPLYNSILWANWTPESLSKIIIIGNSLVKFATDPYPSMMSTLQCKYSYLFKVLPAVIEHDVHNTFHSENVFNDFTVTTFDSAVLQSFSGDMWQNVEEPFYGSEDEIILKR